MTKSAGNIKPFDEKRRTDPQVLGLVAEHQDRTIEALRRASALVKEAEAILRQVPLGNLNSEVYRSASDSVSRASRESARAYALYADTNSNVMHGNLASSALGAAIAKKIADEQG